MDNWIANKTLNEQGTDFREVLVGGKVSKLQFTIKPLTHFWRAGFKLVDPNGTILPLRSRNSLLFHLGSTNSEEEYGFHAYLNGEWLQELNKVKKYPEDKILTIKLEINHNNFLKVSVNGFPEFKLSWHLENPNIREKVALVAWGDENDYQVEFKDIIAGNWKTVKEEAQSQSQGQKQKPLLQVSGNENVFLNSRVGGHAVIGGKRNSFDKFLIRSRSGQPVKSTPWYRNPDMIVKILAGIVVPIIVGFLAKTQKPVTQVSTPNQAVNNQFNLNQKNPKLGNLRGLQPLETGKKIGVLPNGVYFYANSLAIEHEVKDTEQDWLEASSKDESYKFELQKFNNRYYIVGFISDEAQAKIGSITKEAIYTQLFPNSWGGAGNLVSIPFDSIYTIKAREINLDTSKSVFIFDIGFKDIIEKPEFHKEKTL